MVEKSKSFDCVEMKNRLQAESASKYAGMTDLERFKQIEHDLAASDEPLARWWRRNQTSRSER